MRTKILGVFAHMQLPDTFSNDYNIVVYNLVISLVHTWRLVTGYLVVFCTKFCEYELPYAQNRRHHALFGWS